MTIMNEGTNAAGYVPYNILRFMLFKFYSKKISVKGYVKLNLNYNGVKQ